MNYPCQPCGQRPDGESTCQHPVHIEAVYQPATHDHEADISPKESAEEKAKIVASYPAHEREARTKGIPTLGSGRIFPIPEETLAIEHREFPRHWPRIGGMDFGWDHPFAAVELVWDRDTDTVYVTKTYRVREATAVIHAAALKLWGKTLPWAWPRDGRRETAPASRWPISTRRKASRCSACTPNSTMARCRSRPVSRTC
jgi:hypothetical protein